MPLAPAPHQPPRSRDSKAPTALVVVSVVAALYLARQVLIPLALAGLLTFLLAPAVRRVERLGLGRAAGVLIVVGAMGLALGGVAWVLEEQVGDLATKLPEYRANIRTKLESVRGDGTGPWARAGRVIAEIGNDLSRTTAVLPDAASESAAEVVPVKVTDVSPTPLGNAKSLLGPVLAPLITMGLVTVFTIFMLLKREDLRDRFIRLVGPRSLHLTTQALDDAAHRVNQYLVMQLAANAIAGVAVGIGLYALGMPSPALWAAMVVILRFVPFIGTWIAAALPLALCVAQSPGWSEPLMALGVFALVEVVVANFVEPLLLGTGTGLSAIAILVSAVFWGWLWGGVGLVLATPLTVCVAVIGRHVPHLAFFDVLLGKESALPAEARLYQRLLAGDVDEAVRVVREFSKPDKANKGAPALAPGAVYDGLVLPALRMAEEDRVRGDLDEGRERFITHAMEQILDTVGGASGSGAAGTGSSGTGSSGGAGANANADSAGDNQNTPVLIAPVWDAADGLSAQMFADVLRTAGVATYELSSEAFSGEVIAAVEKRRPSVVCLVSVPPGAVSPSRVLYKRLKARVPDAHIVVALWDPSIDGADVTNTLGIEGADRVVTSMEEGLTVVKALVGVTVVVGMPGGAPAIAAAPK